MDEAPKSLSPAGERLAAAEDVLVGMVDALDAMAYGARYLSPKLVGDIEVVRSGAEQVLRELGEAQGILGGGRQHG
jgi:hypothetical protein